MSREELTILSCLLSKYLLAEGQKDAPRFHGGYGCHVCGGVGNLVVSLHDDVNKYKEVA